VSHTICLQLAFGASLFFGIGLQSAIEAGPGPQKAESMDFTFSIYSTDTIGTLTAIRLTSFRHEPSLVESHVSGLDQSVSVFPLQQPDAKPVLTWQLPQRMGMAQWDAVAASPTALAVVSTDPGSSRSPLRFGVSDRPAEVSLTGRDPSGVFQRPRFVKGRAEAEAAVSSVRSDEHPPRVVVFGSALQADSAATDVPVTGGILERALIVRFGPGYLLFYKLPGTPEGGGNSNQVPPERRVRSLNGPVRSGPMYCLRLDAHFQRRGEAARLAGPDVFEFDVDAGQGRLILFATTLGGFRLGIGADGGNDELPGWSFRDIDRPEPLESPSVLVTGGQIHLAAIESSVSHPARILTLRGGQ